MVEYDDVLEDLWLAPKMRGRRRFTWRHLWAVAIAPVAAPMIVLPWPYVVITLPSGAGAPDRRQCQTLAGGYSRGWPCSVPLVRSRRAL